MNYYVTYMFILNIFFFILVLELVHWWELLVRWSGPTPFTLNWFLVHSFVLIAKLQFLTWNNNSSIPSPQFVEILFVTIVQDLHWTLANPDLLTFKKFAFKKSKVNYPVAASLEVWKLFSELRLSRGHNPVTELTLWVSKSFKIFLRDFQSQHRYSLINMRQLHIFFY